MADKKISELDLALLINDDAEFPISQDNAGDPTTFKGRITQLGTKIAEDMTFSNLQTTSKKLVGAINELLRLGSPIILGTSAPTSSVGANGNLYVQYTAGTGGADDTVDGIYVKIDGAWCEISTGGGSGTTDYEDLSNKPQVNSVELVGNKSLDDLGIMPASLSKTVSGSIAHFTDGADNIPVKSLVSEIVAVESGSGEKSPENPYIISGFDKAIITRCGVNVWDEQWEVGAFNDSTGDKVYSASRIRSKNFIPALPNTTYGFYFPSRASASTGNIRVFFYDENKAFISFQNWIVAGTFTTPSDTKYMMFYTNGSYGETYLNDISILYPSDTTPEYLAYNGNIYTFAFGQTVYGGHFDNKGNLVVTHGYIASYNGETINEPWVSSMDNYVPNTSPSTGAQVVYPLTTPITLAITSQDIPTLLGENNIYSNCGDVEVNYYTNKADEIVEVSKATASTPLHSYSTDEQVVGTWVDGSTLYEKTIYNVGGTSGEINIQHGVSNLDKIVYAEGVCADSGATPYNYYPFSRISNDGYNIGISVATTSMVSVYIPSAFQQRIVDIYVTIRYTKTSSNTRNLNLSNPVEETELAEETEEQEEQER